MFSLPLGLLILLPYATPVTSLFETKSDVLGNVVHVPKPYMALQIFHPQFPPANVIASKTTLLTASPGVTFRAECFDYDSDDPRAFLYSPAGVLVESLALVFVAGACDSLESYVVPQAQEEEEARHGQTMEVTYLMAGKVPKCVRRKYTVVDAAVVAYVETKDLPDVECPVSLYQMIQKGAAAGGVVALTPMGNIYHMDYIKSLKTPGEIQEFTFETQDLKNKHFKLKCREDALYTKSTITGQLKIATAMIVHEEDEFIVDKLVVNSCSLGVTGINVNRRTIEGDDEFKLVYKLKKGRCYERMVLKRNKLRFRYHHQFTVQRGVQRRVPCPTVWSGDIGMNSVLPWYMRLVKLLLGEGHPMVVPNSFMHDLTSL